MAVMVSDEDFDENGVADLIDILDQPVSEATVRIETASEDELAPEELREILSTGVVGQIVFEGSPEAEDLDGVDIKHEHLQKERDKELERLEQARAQLDNDIKQGIKFDSIDNVDDEEPTRLATAEDFDATFGTATRDVKKCNSSTGEIMFETKLKNTATLKEERPRYNKEQIVIIEAAEQYLGYLKENIDIINTDGYTRFELEYCDIDECEGIDELSSQDDKNEILIINDFSSYISGVKHIEDETGYVVEVGKNIWRYLKQNGYKLIQTDESVILTWECE